MRLVECANADLTERIDGIEQVLAFLLRFCRERLLELRAAMGEALARSYVRSADAELRMLFDRIDAITLLPTDIQAIREEIVTRTSHAERGFGSTTGDALVARAMANAIDFTFGQKIVTRFRNRGAYTLEPGDPFPVANPDLLQIFGGQLGTKPESRGPQLDETTNLRILQQPTRHHRVILSTNHKDVLAPLSGPNAEVAVVWSTPLAGLTYDTEEREGDLWFRFVRPLDPRACTKVVIDCLETLVRPVAPVVVLLPELSLDPDGVTCVLDWAERMEHPFGLLIPGSAHVPCAGGRCANVSILAFGDGSRAEHRKFNQFVGKLPREDGSDPSPKREDIDTGNATITLYLAGKWSVVVLICKDFLDDGVSEVLADLRAKLVLVPARSPRTLDFEARAEEHAVRVQGLVFIANEAIPDDSKPAGAMLVRPLRRRPVECIPAEEVRPPAMKRFRIRPS